MKPCSKNRKLIAWLALDALDARQARDLRAHLETCDACRRYFEEISNVAGKLIAAEIRPDAQASESFHRRLVGRLRTEEPGSLWETLVSFLRAGSLNWRMALPVIGATAALVVALALYERHPGDSSHPTPGVPAVTAMDLKRDLPPTIANYEMVANQSLEKLDELLTRQGNRNPPPTRIYTASDALD